MLDVFDLTRELENMEYITEKDPENAPYAEAWEVIQHIDDRLPNVWKDDLEWSEVDIATNGDELLFKYKTDCERIADLLDEKVFCANECHTGLYDYDEDVKNDCVDVNTGWYYISWD